MNEESHTQNSVRSLSSMDFFNYIAEEEKQRTARDVLCLLYSLNKEHIMAHLKGKTGAVEAIEKWILEIETDI